MVGLEDEFVALFCLCQAALSLFFSGLQPEPWLPRKSMRAMGMLRQRS
jgi:hypothetical protein